MKNICDKRTRVIMYLLLLINVGLIVTPVLIKFNVKCPVCHAVPYLPIKDLELGILGVSSNILLGVLWYFSTNKILIYITLLYNTFLCGFSTLLQIGRYIMLSGYCSYCLLSTLVFYILFGFYIYNIARILKLNTT